MTDSKKVSVILLVRAGSLQWAMTGISVSKFIFLSELPITGIHIWVFNEMEDTNESTNLCKLADVWMSKNRCCQGHRNRSAVSVTRVTVDIGHPNQEEEEVNPTSFPEPKADAKCPFSPNSMVKNHRVRNPSQASIAAAQPLKHVKTWKNEVLNSTKSERINRIFVNGKYWQCDMRRNYLWTLLAASSNAASSFYVRNNWSCRGWSRHIGRLKAVFIRGNRRSRLRAVRKGGREAGTGR